MIAELISRRFSDGIRLKSNVSAETLTTFRLGGKITLLAEPRNIGVLQDFLPFLRAHDIAWRVLGFGSNLLVSDEGVGGAVIHLGNEWSKYLPLAAAPAPQDLAMYLEESAGSGSGEGILVFAGLALMTLSRRLSEEGFSGLEFASGIPASLGGAVRMNAGAHGRSMAEVIEEVYVVNAAGAVERISKEKLSPSYRCLNLPPESIVIAAYLRLHACNPQAVMAERNRCLDYRKRTQPLQLPSAGSVFRNPSPEHPAGRLLEEAGFKGVQIGGVAFSDLHANWIVKVSPTATAADVRALICQAQEGVHQRFGIHLEPELVVW
jgi:UDP-N-acetylmuramate dehydrogenase